MYNVTMKKLLTGSVWVLMGQLATSVSAFLVMIVFANTLPKEVFGEYRFIISVVAVLAIFTLPGMDTALVQSTAKKYDGQLDFITKTKIRYGLIGSLGSLLISGYYFLNGNSSLSLAFGLIALLMPLYGTYFCYYFYLQGKQRFDQASIIQALSRIFFVAVMITSVFLFESAPFLALVFVIATIISQIAGYLWTRNTQKEKIIDLEIISYGKHITLLGFMPIFAINFDKIFVWNQLGATEVAIYSIAMLLPQETARVGRIVGQVMLPEIAQKKESSINPIYIFKKLFLLELILICLWIGYYFTEPLLFSTFFPDYLDAGKLSVLGMLALLFAPIYIIRSFFIAHKLKKQLNCIFIFVPLFQSVLLLCLVPLFGITGAVYSFLGALLFEMILGSTLLYKHYRFKAL